VCEWLEGTKLLDVFREAPPRVPPALPDAQRRLFGSWARLYAALHRAWSAQVFRDGEFHADPHPGNLVLMPDGRVGLLDWGQTKALPEDKVAAAATCVVAMAEGDVVGLAEAIEGAEIAQLENPSPVAWALIAYTYFDTRWTPLAGVNLYDVDRSLLAKEGFKKNSPEAFPLIRIAFLMRGMQARCGVFDESLVDNWLPDALACLGRSSHFAGPRTAYRVGLRRAVATLAKSLPPSVVEALAGNTAARLFVSQRNAT